MDERPVEEPRKRSAPEPRQADPVWEKAVRTQICPLCGAGPFKAIVIHTSKIHEISAEQICDWIVQPYTTSLCDPELSARKSHMMKTERPNAWRLARAVPESERTRRNPRSLAAQHASPLKGKRANPGFLAYLNRKTEIAVQRQASVLAVFRDSGNSVDAVAKAEGVTRKSAHAMLALYGVPASQRSSDIRSRAPKGSTPASVYVGVQRTNGASTWRFRASIYGERVSGGGYASERDAARAYDDHVGLATGNRPNGTQALEASG